MTPEEANALELGQRVRFAGTMQRHYQASAPRSRRVWRRGAPPKGEGIVIGLRTLQDGECEDGYYDTPTVFYPTRSIPAVMVAYHLRRKPVLVAPEDLEVIPPLDLDGHEPMEAVGGYIECSCGWPSRAQYEAGEHFAVHVMEALGVAPGPVERWEADLFTQGDPDA